LFEPPLDTDREERTVINPDAETLRQLVREHRDELRRDYRRAQPTSPAPNGSAELEPRGRRWRRRRVAVTAPAATQH
jgi:hypothetical protein